MSHYFFNLGPVLSSSCDIISFSSVFVGHCGYLLYSGAGPVPEGSDWTDKFREVMQERLGSW